ncbi:unnamed protein product [Candida verbasci]|uniref:Uncharacterized protein n=1 Tax=Candida verbasci TaxID=1227364 RepID=A0A9W4TWM8_9ASCO|nr:unnamed protein product [Candida verbasci]
MFKRRLSTRQVFTRSKPKETKKVVNQYLPTTALPQIPDHIKSKSLKEIYESIGAKDVYDRLNEPKGVNFNIPKQFIKQDQVPESKKINHQALDEKLKNFIQQEKTDDSLISTSHEIISSLESNLNEMYPMLSHPLKRSISGISKINPELDNIDDEYLWELYPNNKMYGIPPYQSDVLGFKKWENDLIDKNHKQEMEDELNKREYKQFVAQLKGNSLFGTQHRRKLNRDLLKKFKKLQKEGKIPK